MYNQADSLYLENEKDLYHKGKLLIYLPTNFLILQVRPLIDCQLWPNKCWISMNCIIQSLAGVVWLKSSIRNNGKKSSKVLIYLPQSLQQHSHSEHSKLFNLMISYKTLSRKVHRWINQLQLMKHTVDIVSWKLF